MNYFAIPGLIRNTDTLRIYNFKEIANGCCRYFDVSITEILSRKRDENTATARHFICWLLRRHSNLTFQQIGNIIDRHHSNVIDSCKAAQRLIDYNDYRAQLPKIYQAIESDNILKKQAA